MGLLGDALQYIADNPSRFTNALSVHARLSLSALLLAIGIFVPLGALASRARRAGPPLVAVVGAARVVPSLAVLLLLLPYLGTGFRPALVALVLLAGPPIIVNTDAGLRNVDAAVLENARGLGMNQLQVFTRVQFPLALPVVIAGIRTASVEVIASATLAAFIGVRSLGTFILSGITLVDYRLLLVGAVPVALLALAAEAILSGVERLVTPPAT
ncbi:MAG TPA: ABC transporter permease [Thermomicrobiales bacterium]|nr:ABC transporter permease [Thermomicrobiales bacterium]